MIIDLTPEMSCETCLWWRPDESSFSIVASGEDAGRETGIGACTALPPVLSSEGSRFPLTHSSRSCGSWMWSDQSGGDVDPAAAAGTVVPLRPVE